MERSLLRGAGTALAMALCGTGAIYAQPSAGGWPVGQHDARRTGTSSATGPSSGLVLCWSYKTGHSSVLIGEDGGAFGLVGQTVRRFDADGGLRWSYRLAGNGYPNLGAVDREGRLYTSSAGNVLYALDSAGALGWSYRMGDSLYGAAMDVNGVLYVGSDDTNVYALSSAGALCWSYSLAGYASTDIAIGPEGRIFCGSDSAARMFCLDSGGTLRWSYYPAARTTVRYGTARDDGGVYITTPDAHLLQCFDSSGRRAWTYSLGATAKPQIQALGNDGRVYIGSAFENNLYAVSSAGAFMWSYATAGGFTSYSDIATDAAGRVYFGGCGDGNLYCCDSSGALAWSYRQIGGSWYGAIALDQYGRIYAGDYSSILCVFDDPGRPVITGCAREGSSADIAVTWTGRAGSTYRVFSAPAPGGPFQEVDAVVAPGAETVWRDDGSRTGPHPSTVEERYYRVALDGVTYAADTAGMRTLSMDSLPSQNAYRAASLPLIPYCPESAPDVNEVIGNQGHAHSIRGLADKVFLFSPSSQSFDRYAWNHNGTWEGYPPGTPTTLDPDHGFAFLYQNTEPGRSQEIVCTGRVARAGDVRNLVAGSGEGASMFSFAGYGHAEGVSLEGSRILEDGFTGNALRSLSDKVFLFDFASQSFLGYAWHDTTAWRYENAPAFGLSPGGGYLLQNKNEPAEWTWSVPVPGGN